MTDEKKSFLSRDLSWIVQNQLIHSRHPHNGMILPERTDT